MINAFRLSIPFIIFLLLSSGCIGTKRLPVNFSAPNIGVSSTKLDAELKSLTISLARPDEAIGKIEVPLVWCHGDFCPISLYVGVWKTALEEAFNRMAIFKDDSPRKVSLAVKILKFDTRYFPTTHTSARYEIIDRSSGSIIFTTDISTSGEGPFKFDPFCDMGCAMGSRVVDGLNRSVQKNIIQFLQALETVDMDKPMFPSNKIN
jgi:hypothetical protein